MHRLLRYMNQVLQDKLPPYAYIRLAQMAYPVVDKRRRGSGLKVALCENGVFRAELPNCTFHFDTASKVNRYMFQPGEGDIFHQMEKKYSGEGIRVEQDDIVVDVGANVGEFSASIANKAKHVVAIEPDVMAFVCLKRNMERYGNVQCVMTAAGDHDGIGEFYSSPARSNSSLIKPTSGWVDKRSVRIKTVPTLLAEQGLNHIDFLKIDAEGYEPEVLSGAVSIFSRIKKVAVDVSPERNGASTVGECRSILEKGGFMTQEKSE